MDFYGIELTETERDEYVAWLKGAPKTHKKILDAMLRQSEINGLRIPKQGQDYNLFLMQREQFIGQTQAYNRVIRLGDALEETD